MNEQQIKAEARLQALEHFIARLYLSHIIQSSNPKAFISHERQVIQKSAIAVSGLKPKAAFAVAELHAALERLVNLIEQMLETEIQTPSIGDS